MIINNFFRKEQKYILSDKQYHKLIESINSYIEKDPYFKETICNVYFDNNNDDLIINSLKKPIFKEKIRLRSYGTPTDNDLVFLEIKKKFGGLVYKRRVTIKYSEAKDYILNKKLPINNQIMKEIDYYFNYYNLIPKISISYDRLSYYATEDHSFRITFDTNIRSDINNVELKELNNNVLLENSYIMEIKSLKGMPIWILKPLNELKLYPTSYSKYGKIYEKIKEIKNYV